MKRNVRLTALLIMFVALLGLGSCSKEDNSGDSEPILDFKSILDIEADVSIGENGDTENKRNTDERLLDFKSVLYVEADAVISIGDDKDFVDAILGEAEYIESDGNRAAGFSLFTYVDGALRVLYNRDGYVHSLSSRKRNNLFVFKDMGFDMTESDIRETFEESFTDSLFVEFQKFYDANGNVTDSDNAKYSAYIHRNTDHKYLTDFAANPNEITFLRIGVHGSEQ